MSTGVASAAGDEALVTEACVLAKAAQQQLDKDKIQTRIENEMYIRKHPEIKDIMSYFAREVLVNRPANVSEFAASVFADPELRQNVDRFKQQLDESRKLTDLG